MKQLEISNLQKIFGIFEAVKKINFSISENQTVALLGPNGCGKTTTIAMILGLITPTSGTITINNKILTKDHHYLAKMNFASPYVELPKKLKVIENLKVYAMMYEISNAKAKTELKFEHQFDKVIVNDVLSDTFVTAKEVVASFLKSEV